MNRRQFTLAVALLILVLAMTTMPLLGESEQSLDPEIGKLLKQHGLSANAVSQLETSEHTMVATTGIIPLVNTYTKSRTLFFWQMIVKGGNDAAELVFPKLIWDSGMSDIDVTIDTTNAFTRPTVRVHVVEFTSAASITVAYYGESGTIDAPADVTITSVTTTDAFVLSNGFLTTLLDGYTTAYAGCRLKDSTNVAVFNGGRSDNWYDFTFQVVSCSYSGFSVQHGAKLIDGVASEYVTQDISTAVTTTKSMITIQCGQTASATNEYIVRSTLDWETYFVDTDTIAFERYDDAPIQARYFNIYYQVIEWGDLATVEHLDETGMGEGGDGSKDTTITSVDTDVSVVLIQGAAWTHWGMIGEIYATSDAEEFCYLYSNFTSSTVVKVARGYTGTGYNPPDYRIIVVEFQDLNNGPTNDGTPTIATLDDTDNLFARYRKYELTTYHKDLDGYGDIDYVQFYIYNDARTVLYFYGKFIQSTHVFSEGGTNPTWFELDLAGSTYSEHSTYELDVTWKFYIEWVCDDVTDMDTRSYVIDSAVASDSDYYETVWDIETDLEYDTVPTVTDDDAAAVDRGDLDETFHITGDVSYESSTLTPPSGDVDVWVACTAGGYGTNVGPWEDDVLGATGALDVTCYADNAVGIETYTVKVVKEGTGYGGTDLVVGADPTDTYIADRIEVYAQLALDGRVNVDANGRPRFQLRLEYDSHLLTDGTNDDVWIEGQVAVWGGVRWYYDFQQSTVGLWVYEVSAAYEATYGIAGLNAASATTFDCDVIWDQIEITYFVASIYRLDIGTTSEIRVKAQLAYDGHDLNSASDSVTMNASLSMTWDATNIWWDYTTSAYATVGARCFNVTAATEATHGISAWVWHTGVNPTQNGNYLTTSVEDPWELQTFTVEFWFMSTNLKDADVYGEGAYSTQVAWRNYNGATNGGFLLPYRNAGDSTGLLRWYAIYNTATGQASTYKNTYHDENVWYHGVYSVNSTGYVWVYVDGALEWAWQATSFVSWCYVNPTNGYIAGDWGYDYAIHVDEVRFHNVVFDADRVYQAYHGVHTTTGLVSYWPLDGDFDDAHGSYDCTVAGTGDPIYSGAPVLVVWDRLEVDIQADDETVLSGTQVNFTIAVTYGYDSKTCTSWTVYIQRNSTTDWTSKTYPAGFDDTHGSPVVYQYLANSISETLFSLAEFTTNTETVSWSDNIISITLSYNYGWTVIDYNITISWSGIYLPSNDPFSGSITINSTASTFYPEYSTTGVRHFTTTGVTDPLYGITAFDSNTIDVTWDAVQCSSIGWDWEQSGDVVWLIWYTGTFSWVENATDIGAGHKIQTYVNTTADDYASTDSNSRIPDLWLGSFDSRWYWGHFEGIAEDMTFGTRTFDCEFWDVTLEIPIEHSVHIAEFFADEYDDYIWFGVWTVWGNATWTIWDNSTLVAYNEYEGTYRLDKSGAGGWHNLTILVNATDVGGQQSEQTKDFSTSDFWLWTNFHYTVAGWGDLWYTLTYSYPDPYMYYQDMMYPEYIDSMMIVVWGGLDNETQYLEILSDLSLYQHFLPGFYRSLWGEHCFAVPIREQTMRKISTYTIGHFWDNFTLKYNGRTVISSTDVLIADYDGFPYWQSFPDVYTEPAIYVDWGDYLHGPKTGMRLSLENGTFIDSTTMAWDIAVHHNYTFSPYNIYDTGATSPATFMLFTVLVDNVYAGWGKADIIWSAALSKYYLEIDCCGFNTDSIEADALVTIQLEWGVAVLVNETVVSGVTYQPYFETAFISTYQLSYDISFGAGTGDLWYTLGWSLPEAAQYWQWTLEPQYQTELFFVIWGENDALAFDYATTYITIEAVAVATYSQDIEGFHYFLWGQWVFMAPISWDIIKGIGAYWGNSRSNITITYDSRNVEQAELAPDAERWLGEGEPTSLSFPQWDGSPFPNDQVSGLHLFIDGSGYLRSPISCHYLAMQNGSLIDEDTIQYDLFLYDPSEGSEYYGDGAPYRGRKAWEILFEVAIDGDMLGWGRGTIHWNATAGRSYLTVDLLDIALDVLVEGVEVRLYIKWGIISYQNVTTWLKDDETVLLSMAQSSYAIDIPPTIVITNAFALIQDTGISYQGTINIACSLSIYEDDIEVATGTISAAGSFSLWWDRAIGDGNITARIYFYNDDDTHNETVIYEKLESTVFAVEQWWMTLHLGVQNYVEFYVLTTFENATVYVYDNETLQTTATEQDGGVFSYFWMNTLTGLHNFEFNITSGSTTLTRTRTYYIPDWAETALSVRWSLYTFQNNYTLIQLESNWMNCTYYIYLNGSEVAVSALDPVTLNISRAINEGEYNLTIFANATAQTWTVSNIRYVVTAEGVTYDYSEVTITGGGHADYWGDIYNTYEVPEGIYATADVVFIVIASVFLVPLVIYILLDKLEILRRLKLRSGS